MHDKPIKEWSGIARSNTAEEKSWKQFKQAVKSFRRKGGKYIRTWIVFNPDDVWWDDDAEEVMWALPVACEELEKEAQALKSIDPPK
jgi:hypothetical protein